MTTFQHRTVHSTTIKALWREPLHLQNISGQGKRNWCLITFICNKRYNKYPQKNLLIQKNWDKKEVGDKRMEANATKSNVTIRSFLNEIVVAGSVRRSRVRRTYKLYLPSASSRCSWGAGSLSHDGSTSQISRAYSEIVLSLENLPDEAILWMTILVHSL